MNYIDVKTSRNKSVDKLYDSKKSRGFFSYVPVFILIAVLGFSVLNAGKIKKGLAQVLNPVNIVTTVTGAQGVKLKEDDGRTNILILGMDQRTGGNSMLTDSVMIISVGKTTKDAVLISIPRDLWVQSSNGGRYKINELYGWYGGKGDGTKEILAAVENVLGIPVHYYGVINFALFKEVIDTLGGVSVNVEKTFEDYEYPVEGMESAMCGRSQEEADKLLTNGDSFVQAYPCRYEHIQFTAGPVTMNGDTALKYARSRHGDNGEGTDFARARRQQNIMMAVKQKALTAQTLLDFNKVKSLYDLYANHVDTNLDLPSLQVLYTTFQSDHFDNTRTLVLDDRSEGENGGLLYSPTDLTLYGGKYVLIPKAGDYSQIHAYIQKYLFN